MINCPTPNPGAVFRHLLQSSWKIWGWTTRQNSVSDCHRGLLIDKKEAEYIHHCGGEGGGSYRKDPSITHGLQPAGPDAGCPQHRTRNNPLFG